MEGVGAKSSLQSRRQSISRSRRQSISRSRQPSVSQAKKKSIGFSRVKPSVFSRSRIIPKSVSYKKTKKKTKKKERSIINNIRISHSPTEEPITSKDGIFKLRFTS